jgi:hypothetical protein
MQTAARKCNSDIQFGRTRMQTQRHQRSRAGAVRSRPVRNYGFCTKIAGATEPDVAPAAKLDVVGDKIEVANATEYVSPNTNTPYPMLLIAEIMGT